MLHTVSPKDRLLQILKKCQLRSLLETASSDFISFFKASLPAQEHTLSFGLGHHVRSTLGSRKLLGFRARGQLRWTGPPSAPPVTCLRVSVLAFSLEVPISHTHTTVLVPPVMTSLGLGQMAQRIWPHSDKHSYTVTACKTQQMGDMQTSQHHELLKQSKRRSISVGPSQANTRGRCWAGFNRPTAPGKLYSELLPPPPDTCCYCRPQAKGLCWEWGSPGSPVWESHGETV